MNSWQCKEVGDGVDAYKPAMQLHNAALSLAQASGHMEQGFGVFSYYDLAENILRW